MRPRFMLEQLTFLELDPLHFLDVAAQAGYDGIGLHLEGLPAAHAARYSLIEDEPLRAHFAARMEELGLTLHVVEPFLISPDVDRDTLLRNLEIGAQLGASVIGVLVLDPDPSRSAQALAQLHHDAGNHGLQISIEPYYHSSCPTLSSALAAARGAGPDAGVTLDVLHVVRGGEHWTRMPDFDPSRVRTIQLCDGALADPADRIFEAVAQRATPGEGEFGLPALFPLLPADVPLGVEVPSAADAGSVDPVVRARMLLERTRALLPD